MSTYFPAILEKRYAQYPRRWGNEYHFERHSPRPSVKSSLSTLASARKHALAAIDLYGFRAVRIFDRKTGEYVMTFTAYGKTITHHEGYVK